MDLRQLEVVATICREGGFSGAARRLGVTQPTLSKIVAGLEAKLDMQLFDRSGGVSRPTPYGRFLAARAEAVLQSVEAIGEDLRQWREGGPGRIRIGFGPATRPVLVAGLADELMASYPLLRLEIRQGAGVSLVRQLAQGHHDLVFSSAEHAGRFGELMRIKIFEDKAVAAVRPDHPLVGLGSIDARRIVSFPNASYGPTKDFRRWVEPLTAKEEDNATAFIGHDTELIRARVLSGAFIGLGAHFMFADDFASGALVELPLDWVSQYHCWMLTTQAGWRSPVIQAIADLAKAVTSRRLRAPSAT